MKRSFTLIETIVVIAVISITIPVLFLIIFTLMRQQLKIYRLSQIKREGDYAINLMENSIRDKAVMILSSNSPIPPDDTNIVCTDTTNPYSSNLSIYFLDKNGSWFGYKLNGTTFISDSSIPANLTSSKILVDNFSISCERKTIYSPPYVSFNFDICYDTGAGACTSTRPEEVTSIHYQARIKLRN